MTQFKAEYVVMQDKAGSLASLAGDYATIAKQLRAAATSIGAAYDSADGRTYVRRIEEACDDLARMATKLGNQAKTLTSQAKGYEKTEEDNTGIASHLPG